MASSGNSKPQHRRHVYGRRVGHPLRAAQIARHDTLLPKIRVRLPEKGELHPTSLFADGRKEVWLEVGFGGGEHLAAIARENTEVGLIGCEPFVNGVAQLLKEIETQNLTNVRIFDDDARLLMERLAPHSINRMFVLFPDPWPKRRHNKRRFISTENLAEIARILAPGGSLHLATDEVDYLEWMLRLLTDDQHFEWLAQSADDWRGAPYAAAKTRYAVKAEAEGRIPYFLSFRSEENFLEDQ